MAKGNILKKRDSDLTSSNVKPWVDIFWVTWWYWGLSWVSSFPLYSGYGASNDIRYYESWWIIYCMWCVTCLTEWWLPWRSFYYLEINKSSLQVIKRSNYQRYSPEVYSSTTWTYMSIQNISWVDRFCFCCNTLSTSRWLRVYFNWTSLVEWWTWWTPIWTSRYDLKDDWAYNISQLSSLWIYNQTFFSTNSVIPMWQTFTTVWWWNVGMIRAYWRGNWWTFSQPAICKIYNNTFTTLLWTSTNQVTLNVNWAWQELEFRFSWINLSAATQYWFLLTSPTWWNSWTWAFRISYDYDLYSWWKMYIGWVAQNWLDLYFDIIIWDYKWNFTWSSVTSNTQDSYNDYSCATWFLNFN